MATKAEVEAALAKAEARIAELEAGGGGIGEVQALTPKVGPRRRILNALEKIRAACEEASGDLRRFLLVEKPGEDEPVAWEGIDQFLAMQREFHAKANSLLHPQDGG